MLNSFFFINTLHVTAEERGLLITATPQGFKSLLPIQQIRPCWHIPHAQRLQHEPPAILEIMHSERSETTFQDVLSIVDWDMFTCSSDDMNSNWILFTGKQVDDTVPKITIKTSANQSIPFQPAIGERLEWINTLLRTAWALYWTIRDTAWALYHQLRSTAWAFYYLLRSTASG